MDKYLGILFKTCSFWPKNFEMTNFGKTDCESFIIASVKKFLFFLITEESGDSREIVQLRILYDARGKRIDKLSREIEALKQDSDREKRILSHQLAMAEGIGGSDKKDACKKQKMKNI